MPSKAPVRNTVLQLSFIPVPPHDFAKPIHKLARKVELLLCQHLLWHVSRKLYFQPDMRALFSILHLMPHAADDLAVREAGDSRSLIGVAAVLPGRQPVLPAVVNDKMRRERHCPSAFDDLLSVVPDALQKIVVRICPESEQKVFFCIVQHDIKIAL